MNDSLISRPTLWYTVEELIKKYGSDITLGDFWGIQHHYPEFDDDKGVNLVLCNT